MERLDISTRLEKLFEMGYQIEGKEPPVQNHMQDVMLKKRITSAGMVRATGISKQTMHAVLNGKMKPGIDFALKIANVLNVPVEELFTLNDSAWETLITNNGNSLYWDLAELEIVERQDTKKLEEKQGVEYWDLENQCLISQEEYQQTLERELEERMEEELENARKQKVGRKEEKVFQRIAREAIEHDVERRYPQRFQRVVQNIKTQSHA